MSVRLSVQAARQRLLRDRGGGLAALNAAFCGGRAPVPPLEGRYRGELITPSVNPLLDAAGRAFFKLWLPWRGKTFSAVAQTGDNLFANSGQWLARLVWPLYRGDVPDRPGLSRALRFRTYLGPGELDRDLTVLKIDYDWDVNPRFIVRSVLDELVQVDDGYYLGKALLRRGPGRYVCAAYFALNAA